MLMADEAGIQAMFYLLMILSDDEIRACEKKLPRNESSFINSLNDILKGKQANSSVQSSPVHRNLKKKNGKSTYKSWFYKKCNLITDMVDSVLSD